MGTEDVHVPPMLGGKRLASCLTPSVGTVSVKRRSRAQQTRRVGTQARRECAAEGITRVTGGRTGSWGGRCR